MCFAALHYEWVSVWVCKCVCVSCKNGPFCFFFSRTSFSFLNHLCKKDIHPNLPIQAGQTHNSPSGAVWITYSPRWRVCVCVCVYGCVCIHVWMYFTDSHIQGILLAFGIIYKAWLLCGALSPCLLPLLPMTLPGLLSVPICSLSHPPSTRNWVWCYMWTLYSY